ncbi:GTP-binding protein [Streptomyces sp. NPDC046215]|uniref:Elongation factor Tu n=1 Tax=Streptomyces stramineus TaxID=173861 RepID=A0ABP3JWI5_9ACTN
MSEQAYVRTMPHLNIATMGHKGHGKTTLTAAVAAVLAARAPGGRPLPPPGRPPRATPSGRTTDFTHLAYATDTRRYTHTDLPGDARFTTNMIAGAARLDGAILVVSALDGVGAQTTEHVLLARQAGVRHLVVALTKADAGRPERTGRVERDVRRLLTAHGHDGERTAVVRVSGLRALEGDPRWTGSVEALLDAVDTYVPTPVRRTEAPFLLPVEKVLTISRRGTVVTGAVERGTVSLRDHVQLIGPPDGPRDTHVTGLEIFGTPLTTAAAGDSVALLLRGVLRHQVRRGDTVTAPGATVARRRFTARVRLRPAAEGGRHTPVSTGYRPQFHLRTADVTGTVDLGGRGTARPGETVTVAVRLDRGLPVEPGRSFSVREGGRTVATGTVTAVPE